MGPGPSDRKSRSLLSVVALLMGLGASASPVGAAEQIVRGKVLVVKDPAPGRDPSHRSLVVFGKERTSNDTVVGDPVTNGATLEIVANGATSTDQLFILPAGVSVNGSAGWRALCRPVFGYSYQDSRGTNGPVKAALIARAGRQFMIEVVLKGAPGPGPQPHITVVPPAPGTDGGMVFTINGGDTYCVAFGGRAGGKVLNTPSGSIPNKVFKVVSSPAMPTKAAGCPTPPTASIPNPNIVSTLTAHHPFATVGTIHSLDGVTP